MKNSFEKSPENAEGSPEVTATDVEHLYNELHKSGIDVWIDGGWGVDALLEQQTRLHGDLDIAIHFKDVADLRTFLESKGYQEEKRDDTSQWNFVMRDQQGREIDVHAFVTDKDGNVIEGIKYPKESLNGVGMIGKTRIKCVAPEYILQFRSGYEPRQKDYDDVSAICKKFGFDLPDEFKQFE